MKIAALMVIAAGMVVPSQAAAIGCQVTYNVTSQWPGGFGASVAVTNLGDPISGWTLDFAFPSGQRITQIWNAVATSSGVRDAAYNALIGTNGTTSFGFNGSFTGTNSPPTSFALNGTACTGGVTNPPAPPDDGDTVRVMPLGDSITGSPGCWRALLWQRLQQAGHTEVDFVGTLPAQGCGFAHDGDNEGHGGFLATTIANQNQLPGWLAATDPDVVMMHLGTNDVWNNLSPQTILAAFTKLVGQMRASNPAMKILVAQIIPMNPTNCAECGQRAVALNAAIPAWAASLSTSASPVTVVDQWTGFSTATDTYDGVHPNDSGNQKIAARWYPALTAGSNPGDR